MAQLVDESPEDPHSILDYSAQLSMNLEGEY